MLTVIAYQFVVSGSLPRFPYLTQMDLFSLAALVFIAALIIRIPLSRRAAYSLLLMGAGYCLHAAVQSYTALLAAFRRGYEAGMAWPEERIEPFQIGRLLWKINWVARHQAPWLAGMVGRHIPVFEHYQRTRRVAPPPAA